MHGDVVVVVVGAASDEGTKDEGQQERINESVEGGCLAGLKEKEQRGCGREMYEDGGDEVEVEVKRR
jgi:hypothetical protein